MTGSGSLAGGPPPFGPPGMRPPHPPHVSVQVAIRLAAERVTSVHAEEHVEFDAPRPERLEHSWSLETVAPA